MKIFPRVRPNLRTFFVTSGLIISGIILFALLKIYGQFLVFWIFGKPKCDKCNIIVIEADVLGSNHLPCYGYYRNTAPNLCTFAKENVFFSHSYSQGPQTTSSTFSLFTSLYPVNHGINIPYEKSILNDKYLTLTQALKAQGYNTIYVGPSIPQVPLDRGIERGFDDIIITPSNISDNPDIMTWWKKGLQKVVENTQNGKKTFLFIYTDYLHDPYLVGNKKLLYASNRYSNFAITDKELNTLTPEILNYYLTSVSERINGGTKEGYTSGDLNLYKQLKEAKNFDQAKKIFFSYPTIERNHALLYFNYYLRINPKDNNVVKYLAALYDEKINMFDKDMGSFFKYLGENDLKRKSIFILTSAHAEEFMEHGDWGHKNKLFNTNLTIPFIMSIPTISNRHINDLIQNIDLYPTLLGLIGVEKPSYLQGIDLSDLIYGLPDAKKENYVISQIPYADPPLASISDGQWKLIVNTKINKAISLFNLVTDAKEQKNVADNNPEITDRLLQELDKIMNNKNTKPIKKFNFPDWINDEERRKIIKEGYF
ncbi:sulfatase-like hydrolase/transferase [Patescibacteria group bacterium]|nr:sulfatase-like hydrolase/transferase [Patescibacteria group bacterium]MCL5797332.1 sulfatase-like hydrolase/transferase [Patescibacteria group bacterium]